MIAECSSHFFDDTHQCGVHHERVRPQVLVQLLLSDDARRLFDQQEKKIESLGREVNRFPVAPELALP